MDISPLFVLPVLIGVMVGVFSGLLGIGGGAIMIPVFRLLFHMSPVMSAATSLFAIVPTAASGTISHVRHKTCIPALGIAAGLGGALMSPIGVWLAQRSPSWMIMVAAALVVAWSAFKMLDKARKLPKDSLSKAGEKTKSGVKGPAQSSTPPGNDSANSTSASNGSANSTPASNTPPGNAPANSTPANSTPASNAPSSSTPPIKLTRKQLFIGASIGLIAGLVSGFVGVGGAFILVPMMLSFIGISMRQASGTSLISVMILTIPGVIEQIFLGNINYATGIAMAIGSVPGAMIGARLVRIVPERALRFAFGFFLMGSAVLLVVNEFVWLG